MTLATLSDVLRPAMAEGYAVAGLVCLGWEDARAYVTAAQTLGSPVILQAGPGCRAHTPLPVLGAMFRSLAESVDVPVVAHLDHGYTVEECREAIDSGFTSVMFDGSRKPIDDNIELTRSIAELAHGAGVSCEGEIGFVGYSNGEPSYGTDPQQAQRFANETDVDAMAISVGNVHLQQEHDADLDRERIEAIQACTSVPLVIHGGSGVPPQIRKDLATKTAICKFNVGTELRMAFGHSLRSILKDDADRFDRVEILKRTEPDISKAAIRVISSMGYSQA